MCFSIIFFIKKIDIKKKSRSRATTRRSESPENLTVRCVGWVVLCWVVGTEGMMVGLGTRNLKTPTHESRHHHCSRSHVPSSLSTFVIDTWIPIVQPVSLCFIGYARPLLGLMVGPLSKCNR